MTVTPLTADQQRLVLDHEWVVPWVLDAYFRRHKRCPLLWATLTDAARLAFVTAAQRYEPARGVKFGTYASARVWGAVSREIGRQRRPAVRATCESQFSADSPPLADLLVSREPDPSAGAARDMAATFARRLLETLPPVDRTLVARRFGVGVPPASAADIAAELGLSERAVFGRITRALAALREHPLAVRAA